jgi:hypothetical protein
MARNNAIEAMTIRFTVTVDTEEEWDWDAGWPVGNLATKNIALLPRFQEICDQSGVSTTYFADHAVLISPGAREILLALSERPDVEVGMHIHPWNTPPLENGGPVRARDTFLHNLRDDLIRQKLSTVYDCFRQNGLKPTSFRGGRYSSGEAIHEFLQNNGFVADASVCPYSTWSDDGAPDYRHRGLAPVRLPPRQPGQAALWEIPLTLAFTRRPFDVWRRLYELVESTWLGRFRLIGVAERLGIIRKVWLNFESPLGAKMEALLELLQAGNIPAVCFTVHSSSLMAGGNSFTRTGDDAARLFSRVNSVFSWLRRNSAFEPATVSQVARYLEEAHHAGARN